MWWASEKDTKINWIVVYVYRNGKNPTIFSSYGSKVKLFDGLELIKLPTDINKSMISSME